MTENSCKQRFMPYKKELGKHRHHIHVSLTSQKIKLLDGKSCTANGTKCKNFAPLVNAY